jgi:hypothetical protein
MKPSQTTAQTAQITFLQKKLITTHGNETEVSYIDAFNAFAIFNFNSNPKEQIHELKLQGVSSKVIEKMTAIKYNGRIFPIIKVFERNPKDHFVTFFVTEENPDLDIDLD